jgi:hypothetical protein
VDPSSALHEDAISACFEKINPSQINGIADSGGLSESLGFRTDGIQWRALNFPKVFGTWLPTRRL